MEEFPRMTDDPLEPQHGVAKGQDSKRTDDGCLASIASRMTRHLKSSDCIN
jgi:hypothetical protein